MCRGLALGLHKETLKIKCIGDKSHTKTFGNDEDSYLKLELIVTDKNTDGYILELDEQYKNDKYVVENFSMFLTKTCKLKKDVYNLVYKWIKDDELQVLRWLLFNQSSKEVEGNCDNSYQKVQGNCNNYSQEVKGNCDNSYQKVQGNCNNYSQEVKGNCNNSFQKVEGYCYNSYQKVEGDCDNSYQKVQGNCNNSYQKVQGNCNNSYQKVQGDCNNSYQEFKGDCNNSYQEVQGEIYIKYIKNYDEDIDNFIKMLSDKEYNLTWKQLVRLAIKGYKVEE